MFNAEKPSLEELPSSAQLLRSTILAAIAAVVIPVFYLLFSNGVMLGAMSALYHSRGMALDWWGWILPHGVTELLAIVLCGAAGLVQGQAVVFPGRRTRLPGRDDSCRVRRGSGRHNAGAAFTGALADAGVFDGAHGFPEG